jgi:hypothetical protein
MCVNAALFIPSLDQFQMACSHLTYPLQVHAYIISYLKKEMPNVFGKENKKRELIFRLPEIYIQLQREYQISAGDFPEVKAMQVLGTCDDIMGGVKMPYHIVHLAAGDMSVSWLRMMGCHEVQ